MCVDVVVAGKMARTDEKSVEPNDCIPELTETKTDTQSFSSRVKNLFLRS